MIRALLKPHRFENPKPLRLLSRRAMTIAAGFCFKDGILLCADTQHTSSSKTNESKILQIQHCGATLILVLTGRTRFAHRGYEKIKEQVQLLSAQNLGKRTVQDAIERALRQVFNDHIYSHPDWGKSDGPDFSFIIGGYSPIDGPFLLATEETVCIEMPSYVCLGSGSYLGDYLCRIYRRDRASVSEAIHLAIYILHQAKSYDANCGGESEFVVLRNDGTPSPVTGFDVNLGEAHSVKFTRCVSFIFGALADVSIQDNELGASFKIFVDELTRDHAHRKEQIKLTERLAEDLGFARLTDGSRT